MDPLPLIQQMAAALAAVYEDYDDDTRFGPMGDTVSAALFAANCYVNRLNARRETAQEPMTYSVDNQEQDGSWYFWGTYSTYALAMDSVQRLLGPHKKPAIRLYLGAPDPPVARYPDHA